MHNLSVLINLVARRGSAILRVIIVLVGIAGCGPQGLVQPRASDSAITGLVRLHDQAFSLIPPGAEIEVILGDVTRQGVPPIVFARQKFALDNRLPPFAFKLRYDPAPIQPGKRYAVWASLSVRGKLVYISTRRHLVITRGAPDVVDVVLIRVG
jgi:putative lipoprotein